MKSSPSPASLASRLSWRAVQLSRKEVGAVLMFLLSLGAIALPASAQLNPVPPAPPRPVPTPPPSVVPWPRSTPPSPRQTPPVAVPLPARQPQLPRAAEAQRLENQTYQTDLDRRVPPVGKAPFSG